MLLTLVATVVAGPLLVRPVIRVLGAAFPAVFGAVGRMSQRNALRNPRRTGATAAALMVGLALVGGLSVASASMSRSFDDQIDKTLGADFIVQNGNFMPFPREITDRVRDTEGWVWWSGSGSRRWRCGCRTASGSRPPPPGTTTASTTSPGSRTPRVARRRRWPRAASPWTPVSPPSTASAGATRCRWSSPVAGVPSSRWPRSPTWRAARASG